MRAHPTWEGGRCIFVLYHLLVVLGIVSWRQHPHSATKWIHPPQNNLVTPPSRKSSFSSQRTVESCSIRFLLRGSRIRAVVGISRGGRPPKELRLRKCLNLEKTKISFETTVSAKEPCIHAAVQKWPRGQGLREVDGYPLIRRINCPRTRGRALPKL